MLSARRTSVYSYEDANSHRRIVTYTVRRTNSMKLYVVVEFPLDKDDTTINYLGNLEGRNASSRKNYHRASSRRNRPTVIATRVTTGELIAQNRRTTGVTAATPYNHLSR